MKNYLEKQAEESEKKPKELIGTWKDYLGMASKLGMDVKDPIIYRVRKLEKRHNELVQLMIEKKLDIKAEEITEKFPGIENVCENLRKYEYSDHTFKILAPRNIKDIWKKEKNCSTASSEKILILRVWQNRSLIFCS